jgi:hypothetical protein
MRYDKNSVNEKPLSECPRKCNECQYYILDNMCGANNIISTTYGYQNPIDRPVPFNLNCYWWYANSVFYRMSERKQQDYIEERRHIFVFEELKKQMHDKNAVDKLIKHYFRPGGGKLIDFKEYPKAKEILSKLFL